MERTGLTSVFAATLLLVTSPAMAGISADTTRIIFLAENAGHGESLGLTSSIKSSSPYLVKAQVTRDTRGLVVSAPFVTSPSLFRLEPGSTNQVLIKKTPGDLPRDRESLFYFRALAMPAGPNKNLSTAPAVSGTLQIATATVIKLFWRPENLTMPPEGAAGKLTFSADRQGLKAVNPTPYYITLNSLRVSGVPVVLHVKEGSSMIAPYASAWYPGAPGKGRVEWMAINDYGGTEVFNDVVH